MYKIPPTPLKELELSCSVYFPTEHDNPILETYVFPALRLALTPIIEYLPCGTYCIAGGVFRSLFFGQIPTDIDIFLINTPYYGNIPINEVIEQNIIAQQVPGVSTWEVKRITGKVVEKQTAIDILTISPNTETVPYSIQIVGKQITYNGRKCWPSSAEEVLSTFDIIPACFGVCFTLVEPQRITGYPNVVIDEVLHHPNYFYSVANKYLMTNTWRTIFSDHSMRADRFYKYLVEYGFRIPNNKEMEQFNSLLAKGPATLEIEYE